MNRHSLLAILATIAIFIAGAGNANAAFSGDYDVANWTETLDGGLIDVSGAPGAVSLTSSNAGDKDAETLFEVVLTNSGTLTFDWNYSTDDKKAKDDPFGYILNGTYTKLTADKPTSQSGSVSIAVNLGETFAFSLRSEKGNAETAFSSISNFSAPAAVPLPPSFGLMGAALGGIVFMRRRSALLARVQN